LYSTKATCTEDSLTILLKEPYSRAPVNSIYHYNRTIALYSQ